MGANPDLHELGRRAAGARLGRGRRPGEPARVFLAAKMNTLGQKFVTKWNYSNDILLFAIAAPVWASWTPADQKIVREAALDAAKQQIALVRKLFAEDVDGSPRSASTCTCRRRRDGGLADRDAPALCALEGADRSRSSSRRSRRSSRRRARHDGRARTPRAGASRPRAAGGPEPARERLPIDDSIFFRLVRVVNLTARPFSESIGKAHRLSLNEWRVLLVLANHAGVAASDVATLTGLDKMSVSRALSGLVQRGRVVRRVDPADKRRLLLRLSAAGERLYVRIGSRRRNASAASFAASAPTSRRSSGARSIGWPRTCLPRIRRATRTATSTPRRGGGWGGGRQGCVSGCVAGVRRSRRMLDRAADAGRARSRRGRAQHRCRRDARSHPGPRLRRIRRPRPRHARRGATVRYSPRPSRSSASSPATPTAPTSRTSRSSAHRAPSALVQARGQAIELAFPDFTAGSAWQVPRSRSRTPTWSSSATASSPPSTAGTTTRASTCAARRSSCSSTTRPSPTRATRRSSTTTMFKGRAMTYYGRWTYKYEIAAEKGAAAAILVHETGAGRLSVRGRHRRAGPRELRHRERRRQAGRRRASRPG